MFDLRSTAVSEGLIEYNIKLEATYIIPNTEVSVNRAFKTTSKPVFLTDDNMQLLILDFFKYQKKFNEWSQKRVDLS